CRPLPSRALPINDLEGKTDHKIQALEEVEELRTKRADKQSMLLWMLFIKIEHLCLNHCQTLHLWHHCL
ncbi:hypothetical protein SLA2020_302840, partial [Shorea laevis]